MDIMGSLNDALRAVITFVPKLAAFLVILLIGWLIAKALRKAVDVLLEKVHFDRAVERGGIKRALERSSYDASGLVATLVYYAVLLIALQIAFGVFGPNPVSALLTAIVAWLPKAVVAVIIVVVAAAVAKAVGDLIGSALGGISWGSFVAKFAQVFIVALGVIAALNQIGVATAVTTPVLVTVLATIGGVIVVGAGGGLIRPMQQRWERWLARAEDELPQAKNQVEAYQRGREDATRARHASEAPTMQQPAASGAGRMSGSVPPATGYQSGPTPPTGMPPQGR